MGPGRRCQLLNNLSVIKQSKPNQRRAHWRVEGFVPLLSAVATHLGYQPGPWKHSRNWVLVLSLVFEVVLGVAATFNILRQLCVCLAIRNLANAFDFGFQPAFVLPTAGTMPLGPMLISEPIWDGIKLIKYSINGKAKMDSGHDWQIKVHLFAIAKRSSQVF